MPGVVQSARGYLKPGKSLLVKTTSVVCCYDSHLAHSSSVVPAFSPPLCCTGIFLHHIPSSFGRFFHTFPTATCSGQGLMLAKCCRNYTKLSVLLTIALTFQIEKDTETLIRTRKIMIIAFSITKVALLSNRVIIISTVNYLH